MTLRVYVILSIIAFLWLQIGVVTMCLNTILTGDILYMYIGIGIFANFLVAIGVLITALFNKKILKKL